MIEVCDLRKLFGATVAVAGISFDVRAGETFGLLGPNGAGKSTTIAMLTGALAPDAGTIRLAGGGAPREASTRATIGVAPQALSLYEELTAVLTAWLKQQPREEVKWRVPVETIATVVSWAILGAATQWSCTSERISAQQMAIDVLTVIMDGVAQLAAPADGDHAFPLTKVRST